MTYLHTYYDAIIPASFRGDVEWYRTMAAESGGPVLELGAGTGRITLPIAQAGIEISALDASAQMLAILEDKLTACAPEVRARVRRITADMRTFDLPQKFALIIAPFRAFLHNITEADRIACLERVRHHLRPNGCFAFNVFHPSLEFMAEHAGALAGAWRWIANYPVSSGGFVVRSDATRYDTVRQRVHSMHHYEEYGPDGSHVRTAVHPLELAYLYPADIRQMLARAGFTDIRIHGGFGGQEFSHDADELVVEAR